MTENLTDLIEKIKTWCAAGYWDLSYLKPEYKQKRLFGSEEEEAYDLFDLARPELHNSKYNLFLPKNFRMIIKEGGQSSSTPDLWFKNFILHYAADLESAVETYCCKKDGMFPDIPPYSQRHPEGYERYKQCAQKFQEKFNPVSVIWLWDIAGCAFVGNKTIQQEVINFLRGGKDNLFDLFSSLMDINLDSLKKYRKEVIIYDRLGKPTETHFSLA